VFRVLAVRVAGVAAVLSGLVLTVPAAPAAVAPAAAAPAGCRPPATAKLPQRSWAQDLLRVERVWPLSTGAGERVAVVDTGVDATHPQLAGHVEDGYDVLTGRTDANLDCHGHGTFVAGIIAAQPARGVGFTGVAPGAVIVPVRETTTDSVRVGDLAAAIEWAAHVPGLAAINVSTTTSFDDPRLRAAVRDALAADIVVVAAVGNDAQTGNAAKYPAVYPGVLAVGAIDATGGRADYSETVGVDVVAPGQDLISTGAGGTGQVASPAGGTSFAAPYVTGVVALVRAYRPGLSAAQVVARIEATADHPAGAQPDPQFGWGVVDPYAAVTAVLPGEQRRPTAPPPVATLSPVTAGGPGAPAGTGVAYLLAALAVLAVGLGLAAAAVVSAGRARGWRPAARRPGR
jgi:membrane-anchored mycosin MYCP